MHNSIFIWKVVLLALILCITHHDTICLVDFIPICMYFMDTGILSDVTMETRPFDHFSCGCCKSTRYVRDLYQCGFHKNTMSLCPSEWYSNMVWLTDYVTRCPGLASNPGSPQHVIDNTSILTRGFVEKSKSI